jgi:hypothetical protein
MSESENLLAQRASIALRIETLKGMKDQDKGSIDAAIARKTFGISEIDARIKELSKKAPK